MRTNKMINILFSLICGGFLGVSSTTEALETWSIEIYPFDHEFNPLKVSFKGKLYKGGLGISLSEKRTLDNSEQFLRYVMQIYKTGTTKEIIDLWHPDERDKLEFLGKDEFYIKEKRRLNIGNAIEVKLLSRIIYGDMQIYHVLAKGLEENKVIRYVMTTSIKTPRIFLTKKLKNRSEFYLFKSYTQYLEAENNVSQTFNDK